MPLSVYAGDMSARQSSAKYPEAMLFLNTWTHSLNRIRSATSSQAIRILVADVSQLSSFSQ